MRTAHAPVPRLAAAPEPAPSATPEDAPLVVIVASTLEQRRALVSGLGPRASVLLVDTVGQAQDVLTQLRGRGRRGGRRLARAPGRRDGRVARAPGLRLSTAHQSLLHAGSEVALTRLEFALLSHLLPRTGQVATFAELSRAGWGAEYLGNGSQMHAAIRRVRAKLAEVRAPVEIRAVRAIGFRLTPSPRTGALQEVGATS